MVERSPSHQRPLSAASKSGSTKPIVTSADRAARIASGRNAIDRASRRPIIRPLGGRSVRRVLAHAPGHANFSINVPLAVRRRFVKKRLAGRIDIGPFTRPRCRQRIENCCDRPAQNPTIDTCTAKRPRAPNGSPDSAAKRLPQGSFVAHTLKMLATCRGSEVMTRQAICTLVIASIVTTNLSGCQSASRWAWWNRNDSASTVAQSTAPTLPSEGATPQAVDVPGLEPASSPSAANLAATQSPANASNSVALRQHQPPRSPTRRLPIIQRHIRRRHRPQPLRLLRPRHIDDARSRDRQRATVRPV